MRSPSRAILGERETPSGTNACTSCEETAGQLGEHVVAFDAGEEDQVDLVLWAQHRSSQCIVSEVRSVEVTVDYARIEEASQ